MIVPAHASKRLNKEARITCVLFFIAVLHPFYKRTPAARFVLILLTQNNLCFIFGQPERKRSQLPCMCTNGMHFRNKLRYSKQIGHGAKRSSFKIHIETS